MAKPPPEGRAIEEYRARTATEAADPPGSSNSIDLNAEPRPPGNDNAGAVPLDGPERPRNDRWTRIFIGLVGAWGAAIALSAPLPAVREAFARMDHYPGLLVDFGIYHDQVRRLVAPEPSLSQHWLYPPLSALLLLGFGPLSSAWARGLWAAIQVLLCLWLMVHCASRLPSLSRWQRAVCAAGLVLTSLPVAHCVKWGQLSVLVAMLSVLGLSRADWSGPLLVGSAVALKFYPAGYALAPAALGRIGWISKLMAAVLMLGIGLPAIAFGPDIAGMLLGRALGSAAALSDAPNISYQTLAALLAKWFGSASELTASPGPLFFDLPGWLLHGLNWLFSGACLLITILVCRKRSQAAVVTPARQLRERISLVPSGAQPIDAADVVAVMLCTTLLVQPAWMHYFVMLPVGHAILLERARGRSDQLALLLASFLLSAGSLSACLISPELFEGVQRLGTLTLSALLCLFGLWTCGGVRAPGQGVGSAP